MTLMTRAQAGRLLELVNRATGRRYRSLSQAARNLGLSGGAVAQITAAQADILIEEWSARPEYDTPWTAAPAHGSGSAIAGDGAMTVEQATSLLGHEVFVTTSATPDGMTLTPDAVELLEDGRPVLRCRVALAEITSWSRP